MTANSKALLVRHISVEFQQSELMSVLIRFCFVVYLIHQGLHTFSRILVFINKLCRSAQKKDENKMQVGKEGTDKKSNKQRLSFINIDKYKFPVAS